MTRRWIGCVALLVSLAGCDQATKGCAEEHLAASSVTVVDDVFELTYTENHDVGFSLLRFIESDETRRSVILALVSTLSGLLVFWMWRRRREGLWPLVGIAILSAGAVGNLIDRILRGYVVDFLYLHHWPVFNVADVCVVVGAAMIILDGWLNRPPEEDAHA